MITDLHVPELDGRPVAELVPSAAEAHWDTWWRMSPELLVGFLGVLGFGDVTVTHHEQTHIGGEAELSMPMFTVVASRG